MPIIASEIQFFKSTATGPGTGGATISSLGGAITTDQLVDGLLNDLWDDVVATESTTGRTEYRCVYLQNKNTTLVYQGASVFIDTNAPNANVTHAIGLDPAGLNGVAATVVDETTAPAGVTFSEPGAGTPLSLGDVGVDEFYPIWIRRTVSPGALASAADSLTLGFQGASDP